MTAPRRVALQPAFLLHHRDYSDSSRIVELVTREHGRISLFAKGAKRPKSPFRPLLQPFMPLLVSWSGSIDGGQLTGAELAGEAVSVPAQRLMSGFYLNELLLRLTPRGEPVQDVFDVYALTLETLRSNGPEQAALRSFEKELLGQLGYGLDLARDAESGEPLSADRYYHFIPGVGLRVAEQPGGATDPFRGSELIDLGLGRLETAETLRAAKRLLRSALEHCLEGRGLHSREVMRALRRMEGER
jgi:DNA repair protein RecO (recombination protein O)